MSDWASLVDEFLRRVYAAHETACEAATQTGLYGVLEIHELDHSVTFEVSDLVPYGEIHVIER